MKGGGAGWRKAMPWYRALIVSATGGILRSRRLQANDDSEAIEMAAEFIEPLLDFEVWNQNALIYEIKRSDGGQQKAEA
jgi:hypothetical protein